MNASNTLDAIGPRLAGAAILCVFALYLVVLAIGGPISSFGNKETSFVYAVVVFIPVAIVCLFAITRKG
jgi:hypothetical protein